MSRQVLVIQSDRASAKPLEEYFKKLGDKVWVIDDLAKARAIISREHPNLIFVDMHIPGNVLFGTLTFIRKSHPKTGVIITNDHLDLHREMLIKERGFRVFLRQPFTPGWIERALQNLTNKVQPTPGPVVTSRELPKVRWPMRVKITFPYALLALLFAIASAFLVSRYVMESMLDRFISQLVDVGTLSSDWMVQEESRILETLRLLANTEGVSEAILNQDAGRLREIALPIAINYQEEAVDILDMQGISLLSLHHQPDGSIEDYDISQGDTSLAGTYFVKRVLLQDVDQRGDKYAGLVRLPWGDHFYIAGPIMDEYGTQVGVVVVGKSLSTLSNQIRQDTLAQVTIYSLEGDVLVSTLFLPQEIFPLSSETARGVLVFQDEESSIREMTVASTTYSEILGPWEARGGEDLGVVGVSLAQNLLARPTTITRFQLFLFIIMALLGVIAIGLFLAHRITRPLAGFVRASIEVAQGNLEVKVPSEGNDEIMVLAHAFNQMVSGLQEGFIYRDLLGRTVSPEVREALRHSFASGNLRLEGQNAVATVLMSDIRGFTSISENEEPTVVLNWLNEYFGGIVPVITSHGGVVDKFEGDSMIAFFGILPTLLPAQESAYQACQSAVEMMTAIEQINARRVEREEPMLVTGVGINTGSLTAGGLGTADRLNYTIIGDTVNTTQRIEGITREFGESGVIVSQNTINALGSKSDEFRFEPLGEHILKGKKEPLTLFRLLPGVNERNGRGT